MLNYYEYITKVKNPKLLVLLLHGYGSNKDNLSDLARYWGENYITESNIICPNAPYQFEGDSWGLNGFQWFSLLDRSEESMLSGLHNASILLKEFIDNQLNRLNMGYDQLVLSGFSQGCMLSLYSGLFALDQVRGILGYSGALYVPKLDGIKVQSNPEIMLIHGDSDTVVSVEACYQAESRLKSINVPVKTLIEKGQNHTISAQGAEEGGKFLNMLSSKV